MNTTPTQQFPGEDKASTPCSSSVKFYSKSLIYMMLFCFLPGTR
jgi:hypothetical protein